MQMSFNFAPRITTGKRTERLTITCSHEFKQFVEQICKITNESISEIGQRYFIEGIRDDVGNIFMSEPHLSKPLSELLHKKK